MTEDQSPAGDGVNEVSVDDSGPGQLAVPDWVETREYQETAIQSWLDADGQGILRMATGTGKTVTAILAATKVTRAAPDGLVVVVAVPYQHLVDQWADAITDFGARPVLAYKSRRTWQPRLERELLEFNQGTRETCVVITTHKTLANEPTRRTLQRGTGPMLLIGDEVHHLGAPHMQKGLLEEFRFRLGLSATPQRWYDDEGNKILEEYFGQTVFDYGLKPAIDAGVLCEYYYVPHIVELTDEEFEAYERLSAKIGRLIPESDDGEFNVDLDENPKLQQALFKRARLIGTAERKLDILTTLIDQESEVQHTLVYCSDGSTDVDPGTGQRHVAATTARLRDECDLRVEPFTAQQSQSKRQELLSKFETGDIQVLTAIRCLDEGVDVPATRTAFMLASTANPRQYIQRRGRILRSHPGKDVAVIHDFITVPDTSTHPEFLSQAQYGSERSLIRKELRRVSKFADAARNHPDALVDNVPSTEGSVQELRRQYNLLTI